MSIRQKIVSLAQKISGTETAFTENDPEYYALECLVTDEMADLAMHMDLRVPISSKKLSAKSGIPHGEVNRLLGEMAKRGVLEATLANGELEFILPIYVPGILEYAVTNVKQAEQYPQLARAFEQLSLKMLGMDPAMIPVGGAGKAMRVIPVEAAIPAETKTASYEQLSYWLKKYDFFAVGSCSCRISRRLMGEGCGHLEEDMCIAVGEPAQFAVMGGVMRQISYEECLELLRKAEDNGLVHQVTNVDGEDKIFGICNCCRCSCFGLRRSTTVSLLMVA